MPTLSGRDARNATSRPSTLALSAAAPYEEAGPCRWAGARLGRRAGQQQCDAGAAARQDASHAWHSVIRLTAEVEQQGHLIACNTAGATSIAPLPAQTRQPPAGKQQSMGQHIYPFQWVSLPNA